MVATCGVGGPVVAADNVRCTVHFWHKLGADGLLFGHERLSTGSLCTGYNDV